MDGTKEGLVINGFNFGTGELGASGEIQPCRPFQGMAYCSETQTRVPLSHCEGCDKNPNPTHKHGYWICTHPESLYYGIDPEL